MNAGPVLAQTGSYPRFIWRVDVQTQPDGLFGCSCQGRGRTRGRPERPSKIFRTGKTKERRRARSFLVIAELGPVQLPAQSGKGLRDELRKAVMRSRIRERR
jgi:hypothetical protein